ncbi:MAG: hypothetical protein GXO82_02610 [Chlorobi bacterium]|nr:hypothetical protein [Chlorobiota bacterium]
MITRQQFRTWLAVAALAWFCFFQAPVLSQNQVSGLINIAEQPIPQVNADIKSLNISIYGITIGMPWGEGRTLLEQQGVAYMFERGASPTVYVPPQNSTFYFVLNPSSYEVIEMGIIGVANLPLENQFLVDGQRWRLTTARTSFFGNEGEFIVNEEGESYNFPYQGFVLKYINPGTFRFVMVKPTNTPLTTVYRRPHVAPAPAPATKSHDLAYYLDMFRKARAQFENRQYAHAMTIFREIRDNTDDELLKVRAMYWIGESLYGLKDYRAAKAQFQEVLAATDIETLRKPAKTMIQNCNAHLR